MNELRAALEAILFVSNEPVSVDDLTEALGGKLEAIVKELEELKRFLDANVGGFTLEQTAGGWRLATRPEHEAVLKKYFARKGETRLSIAALETLATIAYRQPVTAPEVSDIRGVNTTGVLHTLLERRLIRIAGRKAVVGSPFLYRTTREFLIHFGLNDIRDLPRLEEFGDLIGESISEDLVSAILNASELYFKRKENRSLTEKLLHRERLAAIGQVTSGLVHELGNIAAVLSVADDIQSREGLRLLYVGGLDPGRGIEVAIRALGRMLRTSPVPVHLYIVGDGVTRGACSWTRFAR